MPEPISKSDHSRSRTMTAAWSTVSARGRDRIVLGRFPSVPPAAPFVRAVGASRVGVLDLQLESDGRVRSTGPLARLPDGRIALGFAALGAGWSVRQASSAQRLLIAPNAPLNDTPTYSLGTLLACLSSKEGAATGSAIRRRADRRRRYRGARRGRAPWADTLSGSCAAHSIRATAARRQKGLFERPELEQWAGSAAPNRSDPVGGKRSARDARGCMVAPRRRRRHRSPFRAHGLSGRERADLGERDVSPSSVILVQLARSVAIGLAGPALVGVLHSARSRSYSPIFGCRWDIRYLSPILAFGTILGVRSVRHRAFFRQLVPDGRSLLAAGTARDIGAQRLR